mmetsp:Transcript_42514/g.99099  ORF Transcript_42514/g.99099 Transcript_42514/m.99099 type:complete len:679 (-) Transcript_42514:75-2111(-)
MVLRACRAEGVISLVVAIFTGARAFDIDGCTSIVVNADAMVDGSAIASHSNDCADCDWRMAYVPAKDHAKGSERVIYDAVWSQYPRIVDPSRSAQYQPGAGIASSTVLGRIPQVEHTYALWEASYGLMNEHGLGLGESTCPSYLVGTGVSAGGSALFSIGNLMAIALERCKTARCAIETMGDLGARYGFYGEDPGLGGAGEAVTLVDRTGEAWVFHICGGVPSNNTTAPWTGMRGALWVAQRVPSGHVAVIANSMIIRSVDVNDKENFMAHPGLVELLKESGLWDGVGPLDWQRIVQPDLATFSYFPGLAPIPMYSTIRMWGVYRQAAPNSGLQATPDLSSFPFSVPVEGKATVQDVMNWFRTHYEGTEFDMRYGSLAGPWQSPNRAEGGMGAKAVPGQFARSTSIPRTSYTQIVQSGPIQQPRVWFAPDASATSVFVPFFSSVLAHADGKFDVEAYGVGSQKSFNFSHAGVRPAWWAFDFVANWMELSYQNMSEQYVYSAVQKTQKRIVQETGNALQKVDGSSAPAAAKILGEEMSKLQRNVTEEWWALADMLVVRYNDMFFNYAENSPTQVGDIGYPAFWLEMIGFNQEFYRPHWLTVSWEPPSILPAYIKEQLSSFAPWSYGGPAGSTSLSAANKSLFAHLAPTLVMGLAMYSFGYWRGRQSAPRSDSVYHHLSA